MKKIFLTFLIMFSLVGCAFSEGEKFSVGVLAQLNMTEDEYKNFVLEGRENFGWHFLIGKDEDFVFYDSLLSIQMALNAGNIQEIQLPEIVGEYFVNLNTKLYKVSGVTHVRPTYLAFGFLKENIALQKKFNEAIKALKEDGTLEKLRLDFIEKFKKENIKHKIFEKFAGAETIKVALTGDLPPIDFVDADGTPFGFNVEILAEIGKKLKVNIEFFRVETGARSYALASGRADVAFWYKRTKDYDFQPDIPDEIILSEPYYEWDKFLHITKK